MRKSIVFVALIVIIAAAACGVHTRNGAQPSALTSTNTTLPKTASVIPPAQRLAARDAGIALSPGGYTLAWKYENPGDYNQDGIVALEDIAPLSEHFNEVVSAANEWVDGSGDGDIGVADITPIAMNWGSEVTGYRLDGADAAEGPWSEVAQIELADADCISGRSGSRGSPSIKERIVNDNTVELIDEFFESLLEICHTLIVWHV